MTHQQEVKMVVLNHLIEKYPNVKLLTDMHYNVAYKIVRANALLDTLTWKLNNLTVSL